MSSFASIPITLMLVVSSVSCASASARIDLTGIDVDKYATYCETLPPTPKGEGNLSELKSGDSIQIRYALPKKRPISFQLDFHNIVPWNGYGKSYQLQLRRDSPTGPLIYDGPATNCFFFASTNKSPLELADWLTDADFTRGYLDIYATCRVSDDPWTVQRDCNGPDWDMKCFTIEDTPELRKALADTALIREKDIHLLPWPQKITAKTNDFVVTKNTRILIKSRASKDDLFTAELLRDEIKNLSGYTLPIHKGFTGAKKKDILLGYGAKAPSEDQSYRLETDGRFRAVANTSTGLFYAVQTAIQLLRKQNGQVKFAGAVIVDHPSLEYRMAQYDVARYQTIRIPYLKRVVREMARFKLNQLMLYMEDDFKYTKYPFTGKPGTFTPETARELVDYARKYHVEIVPQLEALGHATRLLSHPEFADLRENGNPWVFDTSNPRTWEVLDDMVAELTSVFNNTKFIHLGCDEFEDDFGQCPKCKEQIEKIGWGGLYAQHVNKLNDLAKEYGRTMIFWTSHGGRRKDVQGSQSLKYAALLPKDAIVMEWNYDGPEDYPEIRQYQAAGIKNLFVAPGVMGYALINIDSGLTFKSINTFYKNAVNYDLMGGCGCTWELAGGAQLENCLYGFVYSAQCGWNTKAYETGAFQRAFAKLWFGLSSNDAPVIQKLFHNESLKRDGEVLWTNSCSNGSLFWAGYPDLMKMEKVNWPVLVSEAPKMERSADEVLQLVEKLKTRVTRNKVTLDAMATTFQIYRSNARKVIALDNASRLYRGAVSAQKRSSTEATGLLQQAIDALKPLQADYPDIINGLKQARDERGAAPQDAQGAISVSKSLDDLIDRLEAYHKDSSLVLPAAEELGL